MKRRRFLQISAAATLTGLPVAAAVPTWQGRGFGADLALHLEGSGDRDGVVAALPRLIAGIEAEFSLYDPGSALSRLNATGHLRPSPAFAAVLDWSHVLCDATQGTFDPTIQSLWIARATGEEPGPVGLKLLGQRGQEIALPKGMALTFNGIAQGYAADAVRQLLADHGFLHALIDMGEVAALGGPWHIGVSDPAAGMLAERRLTGGAMATSSPFATLVGNQPHLMHPLGLQPIWSTVSVEAETAVVADGLSTAAVFFDRASLRGIARQLPGVRRILAVDFDGNLSTVAL